MAQDFMTVTPRDIGTFFVTSTRKGVEPYLVDLSDPDWPMGRCNCPHAMIRLEAPRLQVLEATGVLPRQVETCKHVYAVVRFLAGLPEREERSEGHQPAPPAEQQDEAQEPEPAPIPPQPV